VNPKRATLVAAVLGSGVVFLDSTVVNVALPRIGQELPTSILGVLEGQSYIYNGYLLALSSLLVLAGALNDYYGRRRMFALGLGGFLVTSVLCGLAPSMETLVLFRVLQGAAGALLVPGSLSLLTAAFEGEERGRAFGVWAGASAATTILGPFVGGLLVDGITWRAVFFLNVPIIAVALWAIARVPESRDEGASRSFDWLGALVVFLAVGGLAFGAIYGQQREWRDPLGFVALGVGAAAAVAFPFLMLRSRHPLVPLWLFRSRNFAVTNLSTFVIYGALYVSFYYLPLFMMGTLGYTAAAVGLATVPGTLFLVFFSTRFGALAARHGPRRYMAAGPAVMAVGLLWFLRMPVASEPWAFQVSDARTYLPTTGYLVDFLPALLLFGIGLMVMVAPLTTALMTSVPVRHSGVGSAINNAISRVGPQLAGAAIFVLITMTFYAALAAKTGLDTSDPLVRQAFSPLNPPRLEIGGPGQIHVPAGALPAAREASTDAFHLAMALSAALLLVGAAVNAAGIRDERALAGPPQGA